MLYWICPECGHECPPTVRDCPTCTGAGSIASEAAAVQHDEAVSQGILALVRNFQMVPAVPLLVAASHGGPPDNGDSLLPVGSTLAEEEPLASSEANETIDSLVRPLVESAVEAIAEPAAPAPEQLHLETIINVEELSNSTPAPSPEPMIEAESEPGQATVELAPVHETTLPEPVQAVAEAEPAQAIAELEPIEAATTPEPVQAIAEPEQLQARAQPEPVPETTTPEPVPQSAEPEPVQAAIESPTAESVPAPEPSPEVNALAEALEQEAQLVLQAIAPTPEPVETTNELSEALESQAQIVLDSISQELEIEQAAVREIVATFRNPPSVLLIGAPQQVVRPPAPRSTEWIPMPRPTIPAAAPGEPAIATRTEGPHSPTLNGPSLPVALRGLAESPSEPHQPSQRRAPFPPWVLSFLIATGVLLGAVSLMQYMSAKRDAQPTASSGESTHTNRSAGSDGALQEHPFARSVEVAGVRITNGLNHKPQLQYIVVNHSSREITGLGIRLAMRASGEANNAAPLFTVFSKVPTLGAYQSREIRTEITSEVPLSSLPDWQSLHPDVVVSGPTSASN